MDTQGILWPSVREKTLVPQRFSAFLHQKAKYTGLLLQIAKNQAIDGILMEYEEEIL